MRKKLHRMNQGTNFLGGSFSNRDNVRDDFCSRTDPSIFISIVPVLLDRSNEASQGLLALKLLPAPVFSAL